MSAKCVVILLLALACLATAIATSPKSPDLRYLLEEVERPPARQGSLSSAADRQDRVVQSCSGTVSVNCHRQGSSAGL